MKLFVFLSWCLHLLMADEKLWCNGWAKTDDVMCTAALHRLRLACMDLLDLCPYRNVVAYATDWFIYSIGRYWAKKHNIPLASPGKSLYISITLGLLFITPSPPPPPPPVCLPSLLACYQARYSADGVPLFLIGWLERSGRGLESHYINIVAAQTAKLGSWYEEVEVLET